MAELTKREFKRLAKAAVQEVMEYSPSFEHADEVMADAVKWYDDIKDCISGVRDPERFVRKIVMTFIEDYI